MRNLILALAAFALLSASAQAGGPLYGGWSSDPYYVQYPPRPVVIINYGGGYDPYYSRPYSGMIGQRPAGYYYGGYGYGRGW